MDQRLRLAKVSQCIALLLSLIFVLMSLNPLILSDSQNSQQDERDILHQNPVVSPIAEYSLEGAMSADTTITIGGTSGVENPEFGCMIESTNHEVYCWGENTLGQTGINPYLVDETANMVEYESRIVQTRPMTSVMDNQGQPIQAVSLSAGTSHTCALPFTSATSFQSEIICWGDVPLNSPNTGFQSESYSIDEISSNWGIVALSSGGEDTCLLATDRMSESAAYCMGYHLPSYSVNLIDVRGTCVLGQILDISQSQPSCVWPPSGFDSDQDGWPTASYNSFLISKGYYFTDFDCDDTSAAVNPASVDLTDGIDFDCDGDVSETVDAKLVSIPSPVQVSVGGSHACAINRTHDIYCWGSNDWGQLGVPSSTVSSSSPFQLFSNNGEPLKATAISSGGAHTCIIATNNEIQCWGRTWSATGTAIESGIWVVQTTDPLWEPQIQPNVNHDGFSTTHALVPLSIQSGNDHTCIMATNNAYGVALGDYTFCFGRNHRGQLGLNDLRTPFENEFKHLSPIEPHQNWVSNADDNNGAFRTAAVALGGDSTCVVVASNLETNGLNCFGKNDGAINGAGKVWSADISSGPLDYQSPAFSPGSGRGMLRATNTQPVSDFDFFHEGTGYLSLGCLLFEQTSVLSTKVVCDSNEYGDATDFSALQGNPIRVDTNPAHACVLTDEGDIGCWGQEIILTIEGGSCATLSLNARGSTMSGNAEYCQGATYTIPALIQLDYDAFDFDINTYGGCAALIDGSVVCWGPIEFNTGGETFGYPNTVPTDGESGDTNFPSSTWELLPPGSVPVPGVSANDVPNVFQQTKTFTEASNWLEQKCILQSDARAFCYGWTHGVLNANWPSDAVSRPLDGSPGIIDGNALFGSSITEMVADFDGMCVLLADKTVRCTGDNQRGQLGNGATTSNWVMQDWTDPGLQNVEAIHHGFYSRCATIDTSLENIDDLYCWGEIYGLPIQNHCEDPMDWFDDALFCSGDDDSYTSPVRAYMLDGNVQLKKWVKMGAIGCALLEDGSFGCWGYYNGQNEFLCEPSEYYQSPQQGIVLNTRDQFISVVDCGTTLKPVLSDVISGGPMLDVSLSGVTGNAPYQVIDSSSTIGCNVDASSTRIGNVELNAKWLVYRKQGGWDSYDISISDYNDVSTAIGLAYSLDPSAIQGVISTIDLTEPNNAIGGIPNLGDRIYCSVNAHDLWGYHSQMKTTSALVVKTKYHDLDGDGFGAGPAIYTTTDTCDVDSECNVEQLHYAWGHHVLPPETQAYLNQGSIVDIQFNEDFTLALLDSGEVIQWGRATPTQHQSFISKASQLRSVSEIAVTDGAAALITTSGQVISWGDSTVGGDIGTASIFLKNHVISDITSNRGAFAVIRDDGYIVAWGAQESGGFGSVSTLNHAQTIVPSAHSFAVIYTDGSAHSWGGDGAQLKAWETHTSTSSSWGFNNNFATGEECDAGNTQQVSNELDGTIPIVEIVASDCAFAALRNDGSVIAWGEPRHGGLPDEDSDGYYDWISSAPGSSPLSGNVETITATKHGFAVLLNSGVVKQWPAPSNYWHSITWDWGYGSGWPNPADCSIEPVPILSIPVVDIIPTDCGLMVIYEDSISDEWGYYVTGTNYYGSGYPSYSQPNFGSYQLSAWFSSTANEPPIVEVVANRYALAALKSDGSYLINGDLKFGGHGPNGMINDVESFHATDSAMVALTSDGRVVRWGPEVYGSGGLHDMLNPPRCMEGGNFQSFWSQRSPTTILQTDICPTDEIANRGGIGEVHSSYRTFIISMDMDQSVCTDTGCALPLTTIEFSENNADCDDLEDTIHPGAVEDLSTPYDENCNGSPQMLIIPDDGEPCDDENPATTQDEFVNGNCVGTEIEDGSGSSSMSNIISVMYYTALVLMVTAAASLGKHRFQKRQ